MRGIENGELRIPVGFAKASLHVRVYDSLGKWPGIFLGIILGVVGLMAGVKVHAQYVPVAWWSFDNAPYGQDVSGNNHQMVNGGPLQVEGTAPQLRDSFLQVIPQTTTPFVNNYIDPGGSVRDQLTMEFWFRADRQFFSGVMLNWMNKGSFELSETGISWVVVLENGSLRRLDPLFYGAAVLDAHNVLDGGWHHIAGTFDVKTGTQRLYIDGYNAPGMTVHHGTGPGLAESLGFTPYGSNSDGLCDLDEIALYDTVLPPDLVYQHWHFGMLGQAYAANVNPAGPLAPNPPNVAQGGIDTLEYGPRYPSVPLRSDELLAGYPAPRYRPGHAMPRLLPWFNDAMNIANNHPLAYSFSTAGGHMKDMLLRLAHDYNYYLWLGGAKEYLSVDSMKQVYYQIQMANDPANDTLPRFLVQNWRKVSPRDYSPALLDTMYILAQGLRAGYYLRDMANVPYKGYFNFKRWNWAAIRNPFDPRMDTLDFDGLTARHYLSLVNSHVPKPISMIGENEETLINFDSTRIAGDPEMLPDWQLSGLDWEHYEAMRATNFRERYSRHYTGYQNSRPYQQDSVQLYWYNAGGKLGGGGFLYDTARVISRFADGNHRGTNYWYPETPARWRHGNGVVRGLDQIARSRREEVLAGDRRFMPGVSPGFSEREGGWFSNDLEMLRPGQFLAGLKALGMMSADGYAMYMTHGDATAIVPMQGNWRAWQPAMPAYAQAVTERLGDLVGDGYLLDGDLGHPLQGGGFTLANYFTFNTGNRLDLIVARRHQSLSIYAIHGSAQRLTNVPSHGPKHKVVDIALEDSTGVVFDTLRFGIRAQGSTYILDMSGPDTIFYQLDGWHEWTDPWRWCRDFILEGELADTVTGGSGSPMIHTDRPGVGGDFSEFTTWLELDAGQGAEYGFTTRHADQNTMYVHVLGRRQAGGSNQVAVYLDGSLVGNLTLATNWNWYNVSLLQLPALGQGTHTLMLKAAAGMNDVLVDKVLLTRSLQPFWNATFLPLASAEDSMVCLDDSVRFHAGGNLPPGCLDYTWDFGDGTFGYSADPTHHYAYPDTYQVVLSVHHTCLDSTAWDTLEVVVRAPHVEAGQDTFMCLGDTLQLQGEGTYFIRWREDSLVSSQIVPQPLAWPGSDGYLHLDGWDPLSGCHASDSVHVAVLGLGQPQDTTIHTCDMQNGSLTTLGVPGAAGGYWVWWAPDTLLSSDTVRNPTVVLDSGHVFTAYVSDICRCDTDTVQVTVLPVVGLPQAWASADTVCEGTPFTVGVTGMGGSPLPPSWAGLFGTNQNGGPTLSAQGMQVAALPPALGNATAPITLQYIVTGQSCQSWLPGRDTVDVVMLPLPHLDGWQDTIWACTGAVTSPVANTSHAAPTTWSWSPGWAFTNPNVQNAQIAGGVTSPTLATLTVGSALGCPVTYQTLLMPMGLLPDSVYQCPGDSLELRVSASLGAGVAGFITWTPAQYFSSTNSPSTMVSVPVPTQVTVEYAYTGCGAMQDTVTVIPHGLPEVLGPDTIRGCAGDTLPLEAVLASPVQWGISGLSVGDSTSNVTWTVAQGQPFTLYVASLDSFFCPGFDSVLVTWQDAILGDSFTMCMGDTVSLPTMPGCSSAVWTPNTDISATTGCGVQVWPSASRWYVVELYDSAGCYARDSAWVEVDSGCCHIPGVDTMVTDARMSDLVAWNGSPSFNSRHIYIHGTLEVDVNANMNGCIMEMGVRAAIIVEPGMFMGSSFSIFRSACQDSMWRGIFVDGATASYKSDRDTFMDAEAALKSHSGGGLIVSRGLFLRNLRHVVVDSFGLPNAAAITANRFEGGPLLAPHAAIPAPLAGVDIAGATGGITVGAAGNGNAFSGLRNGVVASNSRVELLGNSFDSMQPDGSPGSGACVLATGTPNAQGTRQLVVGRMQSSGLASPAHGNLFRSSKYGVLVTKPCSTEVYGSRFIDFPTVGSVALSVRNQSPTLLMVEQDTFIDCRLGVAVALTQKLQGGVRGCIFQTSAGALPSRGVQLDQVTDPGLPDWTTRFEVSRNFFGLNSTCVLLQACDHVNVADNRVFYSPLSSASVGQAIKVAGCENIRLYQNDLEGTLGTQLRDTLFGGLFVTMSPLTSMRCNTVKGFGRDVVWEDFCNPSQMYSNSLGRAVDGLVLQYQGNMGWQGGMLPSPTPSDNRWQVGSQVRSQSLAFQAPGVLSKFYVIPSAVTNPSLNLSFGAGSSPIDFRDSVPVGTKAYLCDHGIPYDLVKGAAKDVATNRILGGPHVVQTQYRADLWAYSQLLADPGLMTGDSVLKAFFNGFDAQNLGRIGTADRSLQRRDTAMAAVKVASLHHPDAVEQVHAQALLKRILADPEGFAGFSAWEHADLGAAAVLCPRYDGRAVHDIRALLAADGVYVWPEDLCEGGSKWEGSLLGDSLPTFTLWPNPANGIVEVAVDRAARLQWQVRVTDMAGREVARQDVPGGSRATIHTTPWPQGVYDVEVRLRDGTAWHSRLVVVH